MGYGEQGDNVINGAFRRRSRAWLAAAALGLGGTGTALGATTPPATLANAWLDLERRQPGAIEWQHAFALRDTTAETVPRLRRRLIGDLHTLAVSARVAGNAPRQQSLEAWRSHLGEWQDRHIRTPERLDLPWLAANLRHNPPLKRIVHFGVCEAPNWVEVWSLDGVTRLDWVPDMSLEHLRDSLTASAARQSDTAAIVTPLGEVHRRGIAAWNYQPTLLAPGSRVLLELPSRQGLRGALPFPGVGDEVDLINRRLPELLATRVPGERCRVWGNDEGHEVKE